LATQTTADKIADCGVGELRDVERMLVMSNADL
jgi:hypothetical protein